jgi:hypothetical protein
VIQMKQKETPSLHAIIGRNLFFFQFATSIFFPIAFAWDIPLRSDGAIIQQAAHSDLTGGKWAVVVLV